MSPTGNGSVPRWRRPTRAFLSSLERPPVVRLGALLLLLWLLGLRAAAALIAPTGPTMVIGGGENYTCALLPSGAVQCWGLNDQGQAVNRPGPYIQIGVGAYHACGLKPAGVVECWGRNAAGEAGTHAGPYTQVSAGLDFSCGLTPNGAADCWGSNVNAKAGYHAGPYSQVSTGDEHACALTLSGAVECWGDNTMGQAGAHAGPYTQVSAGGYHTCALTGSGAADCWGSPDGAGYHTGPYTQLSAAYFYTCALTVSGGVECWGDNTLGQVGTFSGPYTQVAAGFNHACARTPAGAADCWGDNTQLQAVDQTGPFGYYPPQTTINASPPSLSNNNDPSFGFSSDVFIAAFECRLDGAAWAACASPRDYTDLSDGEHTFEVRAVSPAGNPDPTPASVTWTLDAPAPETTIDSGPVAPTNSPDATFTFSSSETGSTFQCQLDGGGWSACTSPKTYLGLGHGSHTFSVRASDAAGNTDPTPATGPWLIDLVAPETTINSWPPSPSGQKSGVFAFRSSEGGSDSAFDCQLDSTVWVFCDGGSYSYQDLADGSHTFRVRAMYGAGNVDASPAEHTWVIDTTDPDTTLSVTPPNPSDSAEATFEFSGSDGSGSGISSFQCLLDGQYFYNDCSST